MKDGSLLNKPQRGELEEFKKAFVDWLRGDNTRAAVLLSEVAAIDGKPRTWDFLLTTLWHCGDLLPVDTWEQFCFQVESPIPVSYAFGARFFGMQELMIGYLETDRTDAMVGLYSGLTAGLQGCRE